MCSHPNPQAEYNENEIGTPMKPSDRIEENKCYCGHLEESHYYLVKYKIFSTVVDFPCRHCCCKQFDLDEQSEKGRPVRYGTHHEVNTLT